MVKSLGALTTGQLSGGSVAGAPNPVQPPRCDLAVGIEDSPGLNADGTAFTLIIDMPGVGRQEVFLQHGLSLGRARSNALHLDDPFIDPIHAYVLRDQDNGLIIRCERRDGVLFHDAQGTASFEKSLRPGVRLTLGTAQLTCLRRRTRSAVHIPTNPWLVRCPCCHANLEGEPHVLTTCDQCGQALWFAHAASSSGFEGWLPRQLGPYRLRQVVAEGGMGVVARGVGPDETNIAIKLLKGDVADSDETRSRFTIECRLMSQLSHPRLVRLHTSGIEGRLAWLAMDWVEGSTLASILAERQSQGRRIDIDEVRSWIGQLIDALEHLHTQGVTHRDLKPSNILIDSEGHVTLVDLGIAKSATGAAGATAVTRTGVVVGTDGYLAPEQAAGKGVGAIVRDDLVGLRQQTIQFAVCWGVGIVGAAIGLMISAACSTERAAAAILPLLILPQLLLSRVSIGDGGLAWNAPSAFSPIIELDAYLRDGSNPRTGRVAAVISIGLIQRPAVVLACHRGGARAIAIEAIYGVMLGGGHILLLYQIFHANERRWLRIR